MHTARQKSTNSNMCDQEASSQPGAILFWKNHAAKLSAAKTPYGNAVGLRRKVISPAVRGTPSPKSLE